VRVFARPVGVLWSIPSWILWSSYAGRATLGCSCPGPRASHSHINSSPGAVLSSLGFSPCRFGFWKTFRLLAELRERLSSFIHQIILGGLVEFSILSQNIWYLHYGVDGMSRNISTIGTVSPRILF